MNKNKTQNKSDLGSSPDEWHSNTLIQLTDGTKKTFNDGDWIEAKFLTNTGVRLIQTGNIGIGVFLDKKNKKFITEKSFNQLKCKEIYPGDILICRLADPAGRTCILPDLKENKMITSVDVSIFRPAKDKANYRYLSFLFSTNRWFNLIKQRCGGSTRSRISRGELAKIKIPLPPLPEQQKIAEILST